MLVSVAIRKIVPVELLDISGVIIGLNGLDKVVEIEIATLNTLSDFALKAKIDSGNAFHHLEEIVPLINSVLQPTRFAIISDSCSCNDLPRQENEKTFYRLDLKRGNF